METEIGNKILTDDESAVIDLLQYVLTEPEDFDDPENGSFLDRLEKLIESATEIDATVFKIAIDRTHFFMGQWLGSEYDGDTYKVHPPTSEATDRIMAAALKSDAVKDSSESKSEVKSEILEIVDRLQVDYFWRDADNPNAEALRRLNELMVAHSVKDNTLKEFVEWNVLFPQNEFVGIVFKDLPSDHQLFAWSQECKAFAAV